MWTPPLSIPLQGQAALPVFNGAARPSTATNYQNIPAELRALPQWVMAARDKKPINVATGRLASVTDPKTWSTFDKVVARHVSEPGAFLGIGFVFVRGGEIVFGDLDDPNNPNKKLSDQQRYQYAVENKEFLFSTDSYTEVSQSGQGAHILVKGKLARGVRKNAYELYPHERYAIMTGNVLFGRTTILDDQAFIDRLAPNAKVYTRESGIAVVEKGNIVLPSGTSPAGISSDDSVVRMAANAVNADKFNRLWEGHWQDSYPSQSEADQALINMLAFYTTHDEQVRRLFRASGLGTRDKATRNDKYIDRSLSKFRREQPPTIQFSVPAPGIGAVSRSQWDKPGTISGELKSVPAFDANALLPDVLRQWVLDEAERMPCSLEYIAVAALTALGSVIGARCAIRPKSRDSWLIVPNLWGGIVGDPSAKKSPAWNVALKPLDRLIAKARDAHQSALAEYEMQQVVFDATKDALEAKVKRAASDKVKVTSQSTMDMATGLVEQHDKSEEAKAPDSLTECANALRGHGASKPAAPTQRRYKTNDTTVEKLGELLRDNATGLLVLRDELVGLIANWEREGREGDRAFFLEAWDGAQSFDTDRIGRGNIHIENVCVAIFGGIQPDKLVGYLEQAAHSLGNDGMLQRFQLLVFPDPRPWEYRDRAPDAAVRDAAFRVFDRLADFDPVAWGASPADSLAKFPHFQFDDEAQPVFIDWYCDLERTRIPHEDEPIIRQHLSKYPKLFGGLALIFHLVDCAARGTIGPVSRDAALRAGAWCRFLEAHARRCYGLLKDDGLRAAQALAAKLQRGVLEDGFTLRDVRRHQWRSLTTDDAIRAALDWLEDEHWLRSERVGATALGGRPTKVYRIHPSLLRKSEETA